jgi:hypothetical protein
MAAKLNFSALQEKVVPLRSASLPHTNDEPQQA